MTLRERFHAVFHYRERDRIPLVNMGFWPETLERWVAEGLPRELLAPDDTRQLDLLRRMGMDGGWRIIGPVRLVPAIPEETVELTGEHRIYRNEDGVLVRESRTSRSIPEHLEWLLKDRRGWEEHYRWRLDPDHPERLRIVKEQTRRYRDYGGPDAAALRLRDHPPDTGGRPARRPGLRVGGHVLRLRPADLSRDLPAGHPAGVHTGVRPVP